MSKPLKFVVAASFTVCLLMGCKAAPQQTEAVPPQTTVQIIMKDSPEAQTALFKLVQQDPTIIDPQSGTKYFIMPVKPRSGIDYKIVQVQPDPNIDYKAIIAGPKSQTELQKFRKQIADATQKQVQPTQSKGKQKP
jgi:hypothetical protein